MTKPRDRYVHGFQSGAILASAAWWTLFAVYFFFREGILG